MLVVNDYEHLPNDPVCATLIVAQEIPKDFRHNYMVHPNSAILSANITITQSQTVLAIIQPSQQSNRVSFFHISIGKSTISYLGERSAKIRAFFAKKAEKPLLLREFLLAAGTTIITEPQEGISHIDLSPENLHTASFLSLLQ